LVIDALGKIVRIWAPDDFWQVAQPLIWVPAKLPTGGGKRRVERFRAFTDLSCYRRRAKASTSTPPQAVDGAAQWQLDVPVTPM
jgi:hypothetical protein